MFIEIDPKTEQLLTQTANLKGVSVDALVRGLAEKEANYWHERQEDMAAVERYRQTGEHISHEAMNARFDRMIRQARALVAKYN